MATPQEVKQEQIVRLAPFQEDYLADIFASAKALTGEGSQMPFSKQQLASLTDAQKQAADSMKAFDLGIETDLSKVMVDQQVSSLGFQLTLNVRNKMLSAYKDILNMPV